jgi:hypothetical protein
MTAVTRDPLAIYETFREDQRAEDHPTLRRRFRPRHERIRVLAYSGGWALMRGDDVIESHRELSVALLRQQQLEAER